MKNRKLAALLMAAAVSTAAAIPAAACCDGGCCKCGQTQSSGGDYWSWKYARIAEEAAKREARANQLAPTETEELESGVNKVLIYGAEHISLSLYGAPTLEGENWIIRVVVVADKSFSFRAGTVTVNGVERVGNLHDERTVKDIWYSVYKWTVPVMQQDGILTVGGEVLGDMHLRFDLEVNGDTVPMDYQWDGESWEKVEVSVMTQEGR